MERDGNRFVERKIRRIIERFGKASDGLIPIAPELSTVDFASQNISFENDFSASFKSFDITLTPYLRQPLQAWEFDGVNREVVVMAPEQTGKSLSWIIGLLRSMIYNPCLSLVIYPSDDLGVKINQEKLEPLMKCIPRLASELELPHAKRKDSYKFSNLLCYFQGAGSRITSHSAKIRVCDEIDDWADYEGRVRPIEDIRKRARSFPESLLYTVCTPTTEEGTVYKEFSKSSQGFWYLRCEGCGKLTMRSNDVHNMQWVLNENGNILKESIGLYCPECKHEHKEDSKRNINLTGDYIHTFPELINENPGFCWGALASQLPGLNWLKIAQTQMIAGKSGSYKDQKLFDNSIRGLPFKHRKVDGNLLDIIKAHITNEIHPEKFEGIFYAGDTQDDAIYYIIGAIDTDTNITILQAGKETNIENIREIMLKDYYGHKLIAGIQDEGGHRTSEIKKFVSTIPNMWTYKGDNRQVKLLTKSSSDPRLILVREDNYRVQTIYYLYTQTKKENNYLFFKNDLNEDFFEELIAFREVKEKKFGNEYKNWDHQGRKHDYFDCLKMLYSLIDFYKNFSRTFWYQKKAEWINPPKQIVNLKKPNHGAGFVSGWKQ